MRELEVGLGYCITAFTPSSLMDEVLRVAPLVRQIF